MNLYSLAEAARLTGLSVEALRLRIKRGKLASELGNDGRPRVLLTSAELEVLRERSNQEKPTLERQEQHSSHDGRALAELVGLLRERLDAAPAEELARLREALAHARGRAEAEAGLLREALDAARLRADLAEREREGLRQRAAQAEAELRAMQAGAQASAAALREAEAGRQAAAAEAEAARGALAAARAGGRLARAWRALIG